MLGAVKSRIEAKLTPEFKGKVAAWWNGVDYVPDADAETVNGEAGDPDKPQGLDLSRVNPDFSHHIRVSQMVWGEGYMTPGGTEYMEEWSQQLSLTKEKSAAFLGVGLGGQGRDMARSSGCWFTCYERNAELAALAIEQNTMAGLAKKVAVNEYDPEFLELPEGKFHAVVSKEEFCRVENKEGVLEQIGSSLRGGGLLMFTDYMLGEGADADALISTSFRPPGREAHLWTNEAYVELIEDLGLELRVDEDISARYAGFIAEGWANFGKIIEEIREGEDSALDKAKLLKAVTDSAETWTHRTEALLTGKLVVSRMLVRKP